MCLTLYALKLVNPVPALFSAETESEEHNVQWGGPGAAKLKICVMIWSETVCAELLPAPRGVQHGTWQVCIHAQ